MRRLFLFILLFLFFIPVRAQDYKRIDSLKLALSTAQEDTNKVNIYCRTCKGEKQLTDLYTLINKYFRLAYLGLPLKDKNFIATINTKFETTISKINSILKENGWMLLNLFHKTIYAVQQKRQYLNGRYEPVAFIISKKLTAKIEISIKDIGTGIPHMLVDKIIQTFFTAKPNGEGTGLGLSLSYDIVKARGGEIKVESREGEGTAFIFQLPQ